MAADQELSVGDVIANLMGTLDGESPQSPPAPPAREVTSDETGDITEDTIRQAVRDEFRDTRGTTYQEKKRAFNRPRSILRKVEQRIGLPKKTLDDKYDTIRRLMKEVLQEQKTSPPAAAAPAAAATASPSTDEDDAGATADVDEDEDGEDGDDADDGEDDVDVDGGENDEDGGEDDADEDEDNEGDEDDGEQGEVDEDGPPEGSRPTKRKKQKGPVQEDGDDDEDEDDEDTLPADAMTRQDYLQTHHPEVIFPDSAEMQATLAAYTRTENPVPRFSRPILSKYEAASVVGMRAQQIVQGAAPLVDAPTDDPIEIAQAELKAKIIPVAIRRILPNGTPEYWRLSELRYYG